MVRRITLLLFGLTIGLCLFGCSEETTSTPVTQSKAVAPKPAAKNVPPPKESQEEKAEEYLYIAEGRRDPFVPLALIRTPLKKVENAEPETPLQSYDVGQFRLIGLIVGKGAPKAMVIAPDGKSYVLAKGLKIGKNNGVIIDITSEAVVIEETYYDFSDNVIKNMQEITVPIREGV